MGSACGHCEKCAWERGQLAPAESHYICVTPAGNPHQMVDAAFQRGRGAFVFDDGEGTKIAMTYCADCLGQAIWMRTPDGAIRGGHVKWQVVKPASST